MISLLALAEKRPFLFDGAMGTMIDACGLSKKDYIGCPQCNPILNLSRPDVIESIHTAYLEAGADIITTNTFGASSVALCDYGLQGKARELNKAAVEIAKRAAEKFSTRERPRFVAGEIGPTSKLPTLGHIKFEDLFLSYKTQVKTLLESGADLILTATCQDILQVKAAASASREAMKQTGRNVPLFISVTVEKNGKMLLGSTVMAALAAIEPFLPDAFGINCATGPEMMEEYLKELSLESPFPVLCRPNAGLPENLDGKTVYSLPPEKFAVQLKKYIEELGLQFVGGCCGTTPEYIRMLAREVSGISMPKRKIKDFSCVSSLFSAVPLLQEPRPFIIAEQTNANGSKRFKDFLLKNDYDAMAAVGKEAADGAHALDVCVAYAGRNEVKDMTEILSRLAKAVDAPLMIDSTNPAVIETALSISPGRCIINSINLEDGGKKAENIIGLAKKYGAALVCMTVGEDGIAKTSEKKLELAKRIYELCISRGMRAKDIFIDLLTLTVASGDKSLEDAAKETISALKKIKKVLPGVKTILGVSNVSYGLAPPARAVVTSIFFYQALDAGLDAAIINPSRILRLAHIPKTERNLALDLLENRNSAGSPLAALLSYYERNSRKGEMKGEKPAAVKTSVEKRLRKKIVEADKMELSLLLDEACGKYLPSEVINKILLPSMQEVGEMFSKGELPLPFVLQSAEVMREAINTLGPRLKAGDAASKGIIVLATVRGDVHDIGKNLVDIILSNNGYKVVNLGIRQPISAIMDAARENGADAIGLSGLLVSSTEVMKEDLETLKHQGVRIPVLVGGAALTRKFTESTLQKSYGGPVHYCEDAFAGLKAMEKIIIR
jgi:5-methyltetrahydrofolate--homocysteine methyltransferase